MNLYLLRHGESLSADGGSEDLCIKDADNGLTERGRLQAELFARKLTDAALPVLLASPMRRAAETADIIASQFGTPIETIDDLCEITVVETEIRHSELSANAYAFWRQFFSNSQDEREAMLPVRQARRFLDLLIKKYYGERDLVAVGHGGKHELLTLLLLGVGHRLDHTVEIRLDHAKHHLIELEAAPGRPPHIRVCYLNR
jgi:broad specificity phosphatase PhoE